MAPTRHTKIEKHQQGLQCQNLTSHFHEVHNASYKHDYNHPYSLLVTQTKRYYTLKRETFFPT